jgi:two-component system CheB/CheR fusion protein
MKQRPNRTPIRRASPTSQAVSLQSRPIVVGVGASAGDLEAFSQLLQALGSSPGIALVFIQHLAPQHESALPTLLAHQTKMSVVQVTDGVHVEANRV